MSAASPTAAAPARLLDLEAKIEAGVQAVTSTFVEIGLALTEIQAERFYKETHTDFDAYCRDRWGFSKQYARDLIKAASVVQDLSRATDSPLPVNMSQASALASLVPIHRARAWELALLNADGKQPTSRLIVEPFKPRPERERPLAKGVLKPNTPSGEPSLRRADLHRSAPPPAKGVIPAHTLRTSEGVNSTDTLSAKSTGEPASLDEDPKALLARLLTSIHELLLEARTALAMIQRESKWDGCISLALSAIGKLRFAVNSGEVVKTP